MTKARRGYLVLARSVVKHTYLNPPRVEDREVWTIGKITRTNPEGLVTLYRDCQGKSVSLRKNTERRVLAIGQLTAGVDVVLEAAKLLCDGRFDDLEAARDLVRGFCA